MREEHEKVINLLGDNPIAFAVIVEWLYAKTVGRLRLPDDYVSSYVAADKVCVPELQMPSWTSYAQAPGQM